MKSVHSFDNKSNHRNICVFKKKDFGYHVVFYCCCCCYLCCCCFCYYYCCFCFCCCCCCHCCCCCFLLLLLLFNCLIVVAADGTATTDNSVTWLGLYRRNALPITFSSYCRLPEFRNAKHLPK